MKALKKLSTGAVVGKPGTVRNIIEEAKKANAGVAVDVPIMEIFGLANSFTFGEGDFGPWCKINGDFEATNLITGEQFGGPACFLPPELTPIVQSAISRSDGKNIEFAVRTYARERSDLNIGYEYISESLVKAMPTERMAELRKVFAAHPVKGLLTSPKTDDRPKQTEKPAVRPAELAKPAQRR